MDLTPITMDPRVARMKYADYRKQVAIHRENRKRALKELASATGRELSRIRVAKTRLEKEDEELLKAYRALSTGARIIHLPNTILRSGLDDNKLPRLAACRADGQRCYLNLTGSMIRMDREGHHFGSWRRKDADVEIDKSNAPAELTNLQWRQNNKYQVRSTAKVPVIPPHLRPANLEKFYILWEAEWSHEAPVDPVLLSRVNKDMFAIVAQWDLTPLEQAVVEGRGL